MEINEGHLNESGGYLVTACYSKGLSHHPLKGHKGRHMTRKALSLKEKERKGEKEGFRYVLIRVWHGEDTARISSNFSSQTILVYIDSFEGKLNETQVVIM